MASSAQSVRRGAIELLYHVAMALARGRASMPRAIGPYLATACKRRMLSEQRQQLVRERHEIERADETGAIGERAVLGLCSEDAVRSSFGPDWEAPPLSPTLERLASALDEGVSLQERQILSWLEERVSFSEIAGELGISRSAAIKRVARLRERLVDAAYRLGESMDRTDLSELVRFFRRSRFADEARLAIMVNRIAARSSRDSEL